MKRVHNLIIPDMYNHEQKIKFVDGDKKHDKYAMYTFFRMVRPMEEQLRQDVSTFSKEDLIELFINNDWINTKTKINMSSVLSMYVDWCVENNYVDQTAISEVKQFKKDGIPPERIVNKSYYFSEDDLIDRTTCLFVYFDYDVNYYAKWVVLWWLTFNQIEFDDAAIIENTSVNLNNRTINVKRLSKGTLQQYQNEVLQIPIKMYKYFERTIEADSFWVSGFNHYRKLNKRKYLLYLNGNNDNQEIVDRGMINTCTRMMTEMNELLRKQSRNHLFLDEIPDIKDVYKSGLFCKVYTVYGETATAKDIQSCMIREPRYREAKSLEYDYQVWLANRRRMKFV